jgi:hypothetical protein
MWQYKLACHISSQSAMVFICVELTFLPFSCLVSQIGMPVPMGIAAARPRLAARLWPSPSRSHPRRLASRRYRGPLAAHRLAARHLTDRRPHTHIHLPDRRITAPYSSSPPRRPAVLQLAVPYQIAPPSTPS